MRFKAPRGDIRWWSLFWFACGIFLLVYAPIQGDWLLAIAGLIAMVSVALIWLDQKWIAPILILFYGLGTLARLISLFLKGFTIAGTVKLIMPLYFAYIIWDWYRSDDSDAGTLSLDELTRVREGGRSRADAFSLNSHDRSPGDDHLSNPYQENPRDER